MSTASTTSASTQYLDMDTKLICLEKYVSFISGAVGGLYSTIVGHPLDTIKSRYQVNCKCSNLYKNVYKGFYPHASIQIISNAVLFGIYDSLNNIFNKEGTEFCYKAAIFTGVFESFIYTPIENIKVRQQSNLAPPTVNDIMRGLKWCMLRESIGNCIYFGSYFKFKDYLEYSGYSRDTAVLTSGGISGLSFWAFMHPIDTYKVLVQTNRLNILNKLNRFNQFKLLYSGIGWCLVRSVPFNCCTFYGYEYTKKFLESRL